MDRQLDIEVASKIFGWTDIIEEETGFPRERTLVGFDPFSGRREVVLDYGSDIDSAWCIVHRIELLGLTVGVCFQKGTWMCCIGPEDNPFAWIWWRSDTVEEAICRCALKAKAEGLLKKKV